MIINQPITKHTTVLWIRVRVLLFDGFERAEPYATFLIGNLTEIIIIERA